MTTEWFGQLSGGQTSAVASVVGAPGPGVPVGGTTGQVLAKINSTDYNTQWVQAGSTGSGSGDMSASTYDPQDIAADAFAWGNFTGTPTTIAGYGITNAQPLATVLTDTTAAFTTGQADAIIVNTAKTSNATHTGDATGATGLTVSGINGTSLAGLATGLLKNTTSTGVPSIASNSDLPTMTAKIGRASCKERVYHDV